MSRVSKELGKYGLVAGEETLTITGEDNHATIMLEGNFIGSIFLDATVTKTVITDSNDEHYNMFGLGLSELKNKPTGQVTFTVQADEYKKQGAYNVYLNEGVQYKLRAAPSMTGSANVYLTAGSKFD